MEQPTLDAQTPEPDEPARALRAVQAETEAEQAAAPDGSIVITLVTDDGEAPIRVPPMGKWRSIAKNALYREDDLTWAAQTLPVDDYMEWVRLNPAGEDVTRFLDEWALKTGQAVGEAVASNRSSRRSQRR